MQEIYVDDVGKGFPLVLVHGFMGSSEMWEPQIKHFKKYFRVISPALPGFGKSKEIKSCDSIECMAKAILNYLEKNKISKFNLLGHSMGGMIVQEIVKISEESISKLICYGTGPLGNMPGRFETIDQSREKLKNEGLEVVANRIL
jgi:pimeloyl-ACP methyl ester carboxylesterase